MANNKKRFKSLKKMNTIAETEGGNFGNYGEDNGGGTPVGGKYGGRDGRVGWEKRVSAGETNGTRDSQPRTSDGKFTYNSVNGKETEYDGRGKTVNPLLTGGKNGIMIDDVKQQFANHSGEYYEKFRGTFYVKGSKKVAEGKGKYIIRISGEDVIEIARYSIDAKSELFKGKSKKGVVSEANVWDQVAKGRRTSHDNLSIKEAKKQGEEKFSKYDGQVDDKLIEITKYKGAKVKEAVSRLAKAVTATKSDKSAFSDKDMKKIEAMKKLAKANGTSIDDRDPAAILQIANEVFGDDGDDGDDNNE